MPKLNSYEIDQFSKEDRLQNDGKKKKLSRNLMKHDDIVLSGTKKKPIGLKKKS